MEIILKVAAIGGPMLVRPGLNEQVNTVSTLSRAERPCHKSWKSSRRRGVSMRPAAAALLLPLLIGMTTHASAAPGGLDPGFVLDLVGPGTATDLAIQNDGRIVVVGGTGVDFAIRRYLQDGQLDSSFHGDGIATLTGGSTFSAVAIQRDGRILTAGTASGEDPDNFHVARYLDNGNLDQDFGLSGFVTTSVAGIYSQAFALAIQRDGKIVVAGRAYDGSTMMAVARYNSDGTLDSAFDEDGKQTIEFAGSSGAEAVTIQDDGKIVIAGSADLLPSGTGIALARLNGDGSLDSGFDGDGKLTTSFSPLFFDHGTDVAIQNDDKIVVSASSRVAGVQHAFAVVRYDSEGNLDTSFGGDGAVTTVVGSQDSRANALAIDRAGRILVAGFAQDVRADFALLRYSPDGNLDVTFDGDGVVTTFIGDSNSVSSEMAVQADGRIVLAGWATGVGHGWNLARYLSDCLPDCDPVCATGSCDVDLGCVLQYGPRPAETCLLAEKGRLQITAAAEAGKSRFQWKWSNGDDFDQAALGNPSLSTGYDLCIWDQSASVSTLAASFDIAEGVAWLSKTPNGFSYDDKAGSSDGLQKLRIKTGDSGRTKLQVKGRGAQLPFIEAVSPIQLFSQDPGVIVQLTNSEGTCWSSDFPISGTKTNDATRFQAAIP